MAVRIRLARQGKKKKPQFMIVAVDSEKKRDGMYLENLGSYFPKKDNKSEKVKANFSAIQAWVAKGAQMTDTVKSLLKNASSV